MNPQQKQALSGLVVTLGAALLAWAQDSLHLLPGPWPAIVGVALTGVVHVWPALGTKDKVQAKAAAIATEALDREV